MAARPTPTVQRSAREFFEEKPFTTVFTGPVPLTCRSPIARVEWSRRKYSNRSVPTCQFEMDAATVTYPGENGTRRDGVAPGQAPRHRQFSSARAAAQPT